MSSTTKLLTFRIHNEEYVWAEMPLPMQYMTKVEIKSTVQGDLVRIQVIFGEAAVKNKNIRSPLLGSQNSPMQLNLPAFVTKEPGRKLLEQFCIGRRQCWSSLHVEGVGCHLMQGNSVIKYLYLYL